MPEGDTIHRAAQTLHRVLAGEAAPERFAEYDARYRSLFERYLNFLYFFYDHHCDASSYFWQARKLLGSAAPQEARQAFVHLISGAADFDDARMASALAERHERLAEALSRGRFSAMPDGALFRSRSTMRELKGD